MKFKFVTLLLAFSIIGDVQLALAHEHHHDSNMDTNRPAALSGSSLYQISSQWTDQNGNKGGLDKFRGVPLVFAMAYTSCKTACPILVMDLQAIEKALPSSLKGKVHFALFSFDSQKDSPKTLKAYAVEHQLDPSTWSLLTSDANSVRELAAATGVRYKRDENGDYSHSNVITILNAQGEIIHQQVGLRANPKESVDFVVQAQAAK